MVAIATAPDIESDANTPLSNSTGNTPPSNRQEAVRLLAPEFQDITEIVQPGDDEMSPNFARLPTGDLANRAFIVGTITDIEDIGTDSVYLVATVIGPTGEEFSVYAGQYQDEAVGVLQDLEPPAYIAVTAKLDVYEPEPDDEDDDPSPVPKLVAEFISEVSQNERDQARNDAAVQTLQRVKQAADGDTPEHAPTPDADDLRKYVEAASDALNEEA